MAWDSYACFGEELSIFKEGIMKIFLLSLFISMLCGIFNVAYGIENIQIENLTNPSHVENEFSEGEIIVWFHDYVTDNEIKFCNEEFNVTVKERSIVIPNRLVLDVPVGEEREYVKLYSENPKVRVAGLNQIYHAFWQPSDPYYTYQWHFNKPDFIYLETAWDLEQGGESSIVVAIIDTGVAYENYPVPTNEQSEVYGSSYVQASDLSSTNFADPYDFVHDDPHANDQNGHGTHVCGTIAQDTGDTTPSITQGYGVAGMAFNCTIIPIQVLNYEGSGYSDAIADGISWASDHGADVINMSLGGSYDPVIEAAVVDAYDSGAGTIIVAATGNDNASSISYPAGLDQVIAVGSVQYDGERAPYSNYGTGIEVVAPGGNTGVDQNNDGYADGVLQETFANIGSVPVDVTSFSFQYLQGTSMASPHVAGLVALMMSHGANSANVRNILQTTSTDLGPSGWDDQYGYGLINCHNAVSASAGIGTSPYSEGQNYISVQGHNPFCSSVTLSISTPAEADLQIFDMSGRSVYHTTIESGYFIWSGKNSSGVQVPPGVYFAVVSGEGGIGSCKLVRL